LDVPQLGEISTTFGSIIQIYLIVKKGWYAMRRGNGEGTWGTKVLRGKEYIRFRKTYSGTRKEFYGQTKKEVLSKVKAFENTLAANVNHNAVKQSLSQYVLNWLENVRVFEISDGTYATDFNTYKSYIEKSRFAIKQLGTINTRELQDYINQLSLKYARNTYKKIYTLYNLCFKYAVRVGDIAYNPCENVILPTERNTLNKKKIIPYLDVNDVELLYHEAYRLNTEQFRITGKEGSRVYGINALGIVIMMYTGLRSSELTALQWKDVDLDNKVLNVVAAYHKKIDLDTKKESRILGIPKYDSKRTIPLSDRCIKAFKDILSERGSVHPTDFVITCTARRLATTLDRMLIRAGCSVKHCGLHAIRHTFGSLLLTQGVDLKTISVLLGHKDIQTTANIYLDVSDQHSIDSVALLNKMNK
jgi:integrase